MRRLAASLLLASVVAIAGCGDGPTDTREPVAAGFQAPVDGAPRTSNVFDHEYPFQFEDDNGFLRSWWGERVAGIDGHEGYDFVVPTGTPVHAVTDGVVTAARAETPWYCPLLDATVSGQFVRVRHRVASGEYETLSLHLSRIDVATGDRVVAGQVLGLSGNTGCSSGPHLHFAVRLVLADGRRGPLVDPYGWQDAADADPWARHPSGAPSAVLWRGGAAPPIYGEVVTPVPQGPAAGIARIRWMGVRDAVTPSNEFIDVARGPGVETVDLLGWSLHTMSGSSWSFPPGTVLDAARPSVRVHVGAPGEPGSLGMGKPSGIMDNLGDCVELRSPTFARYIVGIRVGACAMLAVEGARRVTIVEAGDALVAAPSSVFIRP